MESLAKIATFFLCSYMGRGKKDSSPIRFILNLSEALATNSYLMLYPKEHLQKAISDNPNSVYRIWESLKGISGNDIEEEGRIYGGGLKKIEPSELAKVSCGDLMKLCLGQKLVDCLEKCLIYGHIRRFAN